MYLSKKSKVKCIISLTTVPYMVQRKAYKEQRPLYIPTVYTNIKVDLK